MIDSSTSTLEALLFVALFVLCLFGFMGVWCLVCLVLSILGGWHRMAANFSTRKLPSGKKYRFQSARIGKASYKNCLTISPVTEGLYLSVMFLFRIGHPPLLIPWEMVRNPIAHRFFRWESVKVEIGSPTLATLELPKHVLAGWLNDLANKQTA
jgi:hypothetical protein